MAEQKHDKRPHRNEHQWRAMLGRYRRSGLSVLAFCRQEAVSTASFYRWRALLDDSHEHVEAVEPPPAFLDLGALNACSSAGPATPSPKPRLELKLDLGDGLTLHLVRG